MKKKWYWVIGIIVVIVLIFFLFIGFPESYCNDNFDYEDCPILICRIGPSCPICEDIGSHSPLFYVTTYFGI